MPNTRFQDDVVKRPRQTKHTPQGWFVGLVTPKVRVSAELFGSTRSVELPCPTVRGERTQNALPHRGWAPQGAEKLAPVLVAAPEKHPTNKVKPTMADFGAATDRREANLASYRAMSQEERAEWVYDHETAPYVPPFVTVTPRRAVGF